MDRVSGGLGLAKTFGCIRHKRVELHTNYVKNPPFGSDVGVRGTCLNCGRPVEFPLGAVAGKLEDKDTLWSRIKLVMEARGWTRDEDNRYRWSR